MGLTLLPVLPSLSYSFTVIPHRDETEEAETPWNGVYTPWNPWQSSDAMTCVSGDRINVQFSFNA